MQKYNDLSISEISTEFGFTDRTSFCKFFKQKMGMPTLEFRKEGT